MDLCLSGVAQGLHYKALGDATDLNANFKSGLSSYIRMQLTKIHDLWNDRWSRFDILI